MWLIAEYRSASLFSLKSGLATSTGAKTLFVPSPFAIRTALLDAAIRTQGIIVGSAAFEVLKAVTLAIRPPEQVAVTNLFAKVQKPARKDKSNKGGEESESDDDDEQGKAMTHTIAFREYAHLWGMLGIAINGDENSLAMVNQLLPQVNYFGKRGGFVQLFDAPLMSSTLPQDYFRLNGNSIPTGVGTGDLPQTFPLGVIQVIDDWGPDLDFEKVNVHKAAGITLGKDRVRKSVVLPYRLTRSSKSFSLYERF